MSDINIMPKWVTYVNMQQLRVTLSYSNYGRHTVKYTELMGDINVQQLWMTKISKQLWVA
jgi:hypothetical protein